jgi:hypothetical protein
MMRIIEDLFELNISLIEAPGEGRTATISPLREMYQLEYKYTNSSHFENTTSSMSLLKTCIPETRLWPRVSPRAVLMGSFSTETACFFQTKAPPCTKKILTKGHATPTAPKKFLIFVIVPHLENPCVLAEALALIRILLRAGWW